MSFEKEIFKAIEGRGPEDAASLWEILFVIDYFQRLIATQDELNDGLGALAGIGAIRELPGHRYIDARLGTGSADLTPISNEELDLAAKEYHREFWNADRRLQQKGRARPDKRPISPS